MRNATRYAASFGVGSCAGIINELIQNTNHWAVVNPNWKVGVVATAGNLYGWSAMAATALFDAASARHVPIWAQIVAATVAAVTVEGLGGFISSKFHEGKQTWKYPKSWLPALGGYVSVVSSLYFGLGIAAFYFLFYRPLLTPSQ